MTDEPEVPLAGGDVTDGIVRVGATVRRPMKPQTPTVHALLRHLESVDFAGAPRALGIDARGREILSFVEGAVPLVATDDALAGVARLLRALHDATASFVAPAGACWEADAAPAELRALPPADGPAELIGHNDVTPQNTVFRAGRPVAFIDFDLAGPTTRLLDVVTTLRHWVPFAPSVLDAAARTRRFCDAYGLSGEARARVWAVADRRFTRVHASMRLRAELLGGGWARMWRQGAGERIARDRAWLIAERVRIEAQLA